ncbi:MAG: outer membrane beta-barrel protein [Elusimicrobiales bacterium]|nr:outer membrane beta-barrel protein [Elusimicrobiales bacterium]
MKIYILRVLYNAAFYLFFFLLTAVFYSMPAEAYHNDIILRAGVSFTDNVNYSDTERYDSVIFTPGIKWKYNTDIEDSSAFLFSDLYSSYNAFSWNPSVKNYYNVSHDFILRNHYLSWYNHFIYTAEPLDITTDDMERRTGDISILTYRSSRHRHFGLDAELYNANHHYTKNKTSSYNNFSIQAAPFWNFSGRTTFRAKLQYSMFTYPNSRKSTSADTSIGAVMEWDIFKTLKMSYAVSYIMRNFKQSQKGYHSYIDEPWYKLSVSWEHPGYGSSVYVDAERKLKETAYNFNRYYTDTVFIFGAQQFFLLKYLIGITVRYEDIGYERFGRKDNVLSVSPRFEYAFKECFKLILSANYGIRSSNVNLSEYETSHAGLTIEYKM